MTVWQLVIKEIRLRKLHFALALVSAMVAVAVLVAQITLLEAHDLQTQRILGARQMELEEEMRVMEDEYRRIMKKMGFNLLILPETQDLEEFYATGFASASMPEAYVETLAASGLLTIGHLLPVVEQRIRWPEEGQRTVVLAGTRGEVGGGREPMMLPVAPGSVVLGYDISQSLGLGPSDTITLMGRRFRVSLCHPERGTRDDITMWIDLAAAQELLGLQGQINVIMALECLCPGADLRSLRRDIGAILPGVQIVELSNRAVPRAEARRQAEATAELTLEAERMNRARLRSERDRFGAWLSPLVTVGAAVWIGLVAFMNVRERFPEIGILRALGLSSNQIMVVFLARAVLVGIAGALVGYVVGFAVGLLFGGAALQASTAAILFKPALLGLTLAVAPLLAALASWPPALLAARQDPALVLSQN